MHRQPYVELLRSIVASKAPATIESAPTYVTSSSYDDALQRALRAANSETYVLLALRQGHKPALHLLTGCRRRTCCN